MTTLFRFETIAEAAIAATDAIERALTGGESGPRYLILPGGRSARPVFARLTQRPIPWSDVHVIPSDDRRVCGHCGERNDLLIRRHLIDRLLPSPRLIRLLDDEGDPQPEAVRAVDWRLATAVLGVGADGHVASLFPGQRARWRVSPLAPGEAPQPPRERISLSLDTLHSTARIVLLVFGKEKCDTLLAATSLSESDLPVRHLLDGARGPVDIFATPERPGHQ